MLNTPQNLIISDSSNILTLICSHAQLNLDSMDGDGHFGFSIFSEATWLLSMPPEDT